MKINENWMMRIIPDADEVEAVEVVKNAAYKVLDKFDPEEGSIVLSSVETGECFTIDELCRAMAIISYIGENHAWEININ